MAVWSFTGVLHFIALCDQVAESFCKKSWLNNQVQSLNPLACELFWF
jgi:hypothetical protein